MIEMLEYGCDLGSFCAFDMFNRMINSVPDKEELFNLISAEVCRWCLAIVSSSVFTNDCRQGRKDHLNRMDLANCDRTHFGQIFGS